MVRQHNPTTEYTKAESNISAFRIKFNPRLKYSHNLHSCGDEIAIDTILQAELFRKIVHSERLTTLCRKAEKGVIFMVDEVDRASDYTTFLSFLGMLRDKFLERQKGKQPAFSSVILAGVHDIKNLKMKLRPDEQHQYNNSITDFFGNISCHKRNQT